MPRLGARGGKVPIEKTETVEKEKLSGSWTSSKILGKKIANRRCEY